jgi:hypothetical protein
VSAQVVRHLRRSAHRLASKAVSPECSRSRRICSHRRSGARPIIGVRAEIPHRTKEKTTKFDAVPLAGTSRFLLRKCSKTLCAVIPAPFYAPGKPLDASTLKHATVTASNSFMTRKLSYFYLFPLIFTVNLFANHKL